jgi:putative inorganic carbon (hco3(-)) transporter
MWVLAVLAACCGAALAFRPAKRAGARIAGIGGAWPVLAGLAAISASALIAPYVSLRSLLLAALPAPLALAARAGAISEGRLRRALLWGSAVESAIACLQYAGFDPLQILGWHPEAFAGARMRVYGTMGNPAFVAAWLCATLPLYADALPAARRRWFVWAGLALQAAAIFATGSRVLLLALPAALAVMTARSRRIGVWWLAAAPVLAALLIASPARPLGVTVEGRLHLARIAAAHWREIPAFGFGPGAFELEFAGWQEQWIRASGSRRFAGPVDHAHNDVLEFLVEYGPAGVGVCLLTGVWFAARAWRKRPRSAAAGAWGGLASLAAIALVDFPLHRPAEWALFCLFLLMLDHEHPQGRPKKAAEIIGP